MSPHYKTPGVLFKYNLPLRCGEARLLYLKKNGLKIKQGVIGPEEDSLKRHLLHQASHASSSRYHGEIKINLPSRRQPLQLIQLWTKIFDTVPRAILARTGQPVCWSKRTPSP